MRQKQDCDDLEEGDKKEAEKYAAAEDCVGQCWSGDHVSLVYAMLRGLTGVTKVR